MLYAGQKSGQKLLASNPALFLLRKPFMTDWSAGYVTEIDYTYGYYSSLNPLRVPLAFLTNRLQTPSTAIACDLGFGQGLSVAIHAAASSVEWWGTDFNPAQAATAQSLVNASGSQARLFDDSFADFFARSDLPDFDFIGVHGIWTWISDDNRRLIVEFLRKKLKVGGVLYVSYNTFPGYASFAPMRHLLMQHKERFGAPGLGMLPQMEAALKFAERLLEVSPVYVQANPTIGRRLTSLKSSDQHYLAHELFCRDWVPMHFTEFSRWMEPAKLTFAGSTNLVDRIDPINFTGEQRRLLEEITDPTFRELVKTFILDQQFRYEYWVKGPQALEPRDMAAALSQVSVVLTKHITDVPLKFQSQMGEVTLPEATYKPILEALSDQKVTTIGALASRLKAAMSFEVLSEALTILMSKEAISPAQSEAEIARAQSKTTKLNNFLVNRARDGGSISYLASPVTGGGILVPRIAQMFLACRASGEPEASWPQSVARLLHAQGQRVVDTEGTVLESPEAGLKHLEEFARDFRLKYLPMLQALRIA